MGDEILHIDVPEGYRLVAEEQWQGLQGQVAGLLRDLREATDRIGELKRELADKGDGPDG